VINEHKQLQNENTNLISHNAQKDIFIAESKAENVTKSKKIRSMIKILEGKLSSAQKDVISTQNNASKKESEILSLKSKMAEVERELASKVSELECLKSEAISNPVLGGNDDEKNMTKSDDISLGSTDLSKYFIRKKNMNQAGKIDGNISTYTDTNDEITELSKNNAEINPKLGDKTSISKIGEDLIPRSQDSKNHCSAIEIPNITPYLAQPENNMSSLIQSNSQIPIGGIGAMRPSLEALPLPVMTSTLMSPLSAYMLLTLLIIAVMWFVVLRRTWGLERKSDQLR
ncbi:263_t:CDS:1, partial [Paraglomus brasilianum]